MRPYHARKKITIASLFFSTILLFYNPLFGYSALPDEPLTQDSKRVTINAVGDVMMPLSIQTTAVRNKKGYDILFEKVADDLSTADITFANLETPVDHKAMVSGYPKFNTRPEFLTSLKKAGVDILSVANNHIMDAGEAGLKRTLDNILAAGLVYAGAGKTKKEAGEIKIVAVHGISLGFLAYTYSTNERLPRRSVSAPGVNILRPHSAKDLAQAVARVQHARKSADLIIVSLHARPISLAREISMLEEKSSRGIEEEDLLMLLRHRQQVIKDKFDILIKRQWQK